MNGIILGIAGSLHNEGAFLRRMPAQDCNVMYRERWPACLESATSLDGFLPKMSVVIQNVLGPSVGGRANTPACPSFPELVTPVIRRPLLDRHPKDASSSVTRRQSCDDSIAGFRVLRSMLGGDVRFRNRRQISLNEGIE